MPRDRVASRRRLAAPAAMLAALAVSALCALPPALLLLLSFTHGWPFPEIWPRRLRLDLWAAVVRGGEGAGGGALGGVFLTSLALSCAVGTIATAVAYVTAKHIAYHRLRERLLLLAYAPFVMSPVVLGVALLYLYLRLGLAGSFAGVALAQILFAAGYGVVFFNGFWNREKRDYEELVRTLGGGTGQLYARVLLPLSRDALRLCFFQTFLLSWFQYGLTLLIGGGAVQTLPMKVFDYLFEANLGYAAVAGCLLVLPPVALLWVNRRLLWRIG